MMKTVSQAAMVCLWVVSVAGAAYPADLNGIWTKTTHSDPHNLTIIYRERNDLRAVGYGEVNGKKAVWYAAGEFRGYPLRLQYHYSAEATPPGWEQEGVLVLEISEDGKTLSGTATSASGNWSGPVIFKLIR